METQKNCLNVLHEIEIGLIRHDFQNYCFNLKYDFQENEKEVESSALCYICEHLLQSDYESILKMSLFDTGFLSSIINLQNLQSCNNKLLEVERNSDDLPDNYRQFILLFIGVSAMQEFVRCNFSGPRSNVCSDYRIVSYFLSESNINISDVPLQLGLDGESIYSNVVHPELLYFSHVILSSIEDDVCFTLKWWLLRCTFLHQCILPERNESLHHTLVSLINDIHEMDWIMQEKYTSERLVCAIESCHIHLFYGEIVAARKYITNAQIITGLEIELSGAMGKRTQYQQKAVAQLFVKLKRNQTNFTGTIPDKSVAFPADLHLQDDTLLNKVAFIDNNKHIVENLYAEEQIVLLGYCCLVKRSGSFEELLKEELLSYINCLLSQPQIWSVYLKSMIMRCKIEKNSSRRVERAVMQLEAVVQSIKDSLPPFCERQKLFYCTSFPAFWVLEKDLADLLLSIGCTKSSLEIYERLELWDNIVDCYIRLGRTSNAEKMIHAQLQKEENPMLWCLLGDVTEDPEKYLKAWEISKHRSARAQRSLGYYYYRKKEYEECLPHFLASLEINSLQPQVWFTVGHASTQVENFKLAARAYRRVVMFDEDHFEAWNNLANAYIKTKQKVRAWRSLREALKCNYEDWRVWENFLLVSTDVAAFEDALRAWHRLLDIKSKHNDSLLLEILVNAIIKDLPDINGFPSSRLRKRTLELFGRITSIITNEPKIWELYSSLISSDEESLSQKGIMEKIVLFQQKAVRCYNKKEQWEKDYSTCKEVLLCSLKLAESSLDYIKLLEGTFKDQQKTSSKLNLQGVIIRASKFLENYHGDEKEDLSTILESLKNVLNEISNL